MLCDVGDLPSPLGKCPGAFQAHGGAWANNPSWVTKTLSQSSGSHNQLLMLRRGRDLGVPGKGDKQGPGVHFGRTSLVTSIFQVEACADVT